MRAPRPFLALLALLALPGLAQDGEEPAVRVLPVVVTARRAAADPFEEPSIVHLLEREDLQRQLIRTLPEALWDVPGVMVQKTSNGQGSPYLRGFTGFRTVLLVDGIRLNNSVFREGPNQYWNTVDPLSLDRIEVVKGPTSALYGSDAIGGVVQAFTREREEFELDLDWDVSAYARAAEAERSVMSRVQFEGNVGREYGFLGGYSGGYFGDVRQGSGSVQDKTGGYWQQAGDGKFTLFPAEGAKLTVAHYEFDLNDAWRTHTTDQGEAFHGTTVGDDRMRRLDQDRRLTYAAIELERESPLFDKFRATVSLQEQREEEKRERADGRRERQGFRVLSPAVSLQLEKDSPAGKLAYGTEWYHDEVSSFRIDIDPRRTARTREVRRIQGPVGDRASYDTLGLFVQDEIEVFRDFVTVTLGARYTHVWLDAGEVEDPVTRREIRISEAWPSVVGSFRTLIKASENWHLFTGVNQGFRAPNLSDLTRFDSNRSGEIETPAPGLDPEHYLTMEAGSKLRFLPFEAQAAYYYTRIWDMILRQPTGRTIGREREVTKANAGDGFVHGVEGEFVAHLSDRVRWNAHISWQESVVEQFPTSAPVIEKDNLSRMAPLAWGGALRYTHPEPSWYVEISSRFAVKQDRLSPDDARDTQRIPPGGTPGYAVLTLRGGWQVNDNVRVTGAVENVTDANYRILGSGQQEPGVNGILATEIRFP
ncbi:MAG: TonB-dependent receptor [Planctomycetes bacterium]|nr:TonB-dependent receptor [Planctomycetota bacterium]